MPALAILNLDLLGLAVLLVALLVMAAMQIAAAVGLMYLMHKYMREHLTDTTYGTFDLDNFQMPLFQNLLLRLAFVFVPPAILLHFIDYVFVGTLIHKYPGSICFALFLLETAAILAGFYFIFRLDRIRLAVLTAGSAIFYLWWLWYLAGGKNLLA